MLLSEIQIHLLYQLEIVVASFIKVHKLSSHSFTAMEQVEDEVSSGRANSLESYRSS